VRSPGQPHGGLLPKEPSVVEFAHIPELADPNGAEIGESTQAILVQQANELFARHGKARRA